MKLLIVSSRIVVTILSLTMALTPLIRVLTTTFYTQTQPPKFHYHFLTIEGILIMI